MKRLLIKSRIDFKTIVQTIFLILLILFLLTLLVQQLNPYLVGKYISVDYFLIIVIIFGALAILNREGEKCVKELEEEVKELEESPTFRHYLFIISLGVLSAFLIWYKLETMDFGPFSYLISALGGILVIFLSVFLSALDSGGTEKRATEESGVKETKGMSAKKEVEESSDSLFAR